MNTNNTTCSLKAKRARLKEFHISLNSSEIVPDQSYRRNSHIYPLIGYINNITGLYLSKNYTLIPIFIERAHEHMKEFPPSPNNIAYYEIVEGYLSQMKHVLEEVAKHEPQHQ